MPSTLTDVFKATLGLFVNNGGDKAAENQKRDRTFHKCELLLREMDDMKSQLDGLEAREDLRTSVYFFKEGVDYLFKLLNKINSTEDGTITPQAANLEAGSTVSADEKLLEGAYQSVLFDAQERFKEASLKATEAFNNETLSTSDRIQAMVLRVAATILEKLERPEGALDACRLCLGELHCMRAVQNSFIVGHKKGQPEGLFSEGERKNFISTVCNVNRVIYDVAFMVGTCLDLLNWPCVDNGKEYIDPLRDARVTQVHSWVTSWSIGQDGEHEHQLKNPRGIATNTRGQLIVGDNEDRNVKVFDSRGAFVKSFSLSNEPSHMSLDIQNVATDRDNNIYVLIRRKMPRGEAYAVYLSGESNDLHRTFTLRERFKGWNLAVNDNSKVLVLGRRSGNELVDVYDSDGHFVVSFGEERIKHAEGITAANDGRVVVVGTYFSYVHIFNEQGEHLFKFSLKVERYYLFLDVAFHWPSERILVAGKEEGNENLRVLVYTKDGEFGREIQHSGKWVSSFAGITVTMEGRVAAVVHSKMPGVLSKVVIH